MKTKTITIILLYITSLTAYAQNSTLANVNFNGIHCTGSNGICSFNSVNSLQNANASFYFNQQNQLVLTIDKTKINSSSIKTKVNKYELQHSFNLNNQILQTGKNVRIKQGAHYYTENTNYITITFNTLLYETQH